MHGELSQGCEHVSTSRLLFHKLTTTAYWQELDPRMERFHYDKLDEGNETIRLLRMHSDESSTGFRCDVQEFDSAEAPPYAALSYAWGTADDPADITVNHGLFSVRRNCLYGLQQVRKRNDHEYVWVDAICECCSWLTPFATYKPDIIRSCYPVEGYLPRLNRHKPSGLARKRPSSSKDGWDIRAS